MPAPDSEPAAAGERKFLVVVDDSEECGRAVSFAAHRALKLGAGLVLLAVIDSADFDQFLGVSDVLRAEAQETAQRLLDTQLARIRRIGDIAVETLIRDGRQVAEIEAAIADDPRISILVLGASPSAEGPGPLVMAFATRTGASALAIPLTIVPGGMSDAAIAAIA